MSADVRTLPKWKKDSSPSEYLQEIANEALVKPHLFSRIVVIYEEVNAEAMPIKLRMFSRNIATNTEILGVLESAKLETFELMKGRR